jgi:hypothetical protein
MIELYAPFTYVLLRSQGKRGASAIGGDGSQRDCWYKKNVYIPDLFESLRAIPRLSGTHEQPTQGSTINQRPTTYERPNPKKSFAPAHLAFLMGAETPRHAGERWAWFCSRGNPSLFGTPPSPPALLAGQRPSHFEGLPCLSSFGQ